MGGLRRCPFCANRARAVEGGDRWYVACMNQDCFCALGERYDRDAMPGHAFETKADAEKAWNKRPRR